MNTLSKLGTAALLICTAFQASAIERGFICDDIGCVENRWNIYLGADLLYWSGCQNGLNFIVTDTVDEETILKKHDAKFDWALGFRVLAGFEMAPEQIGANLCYTYMYNDQINARFVKNQTDIPQEKDAPSPDMLQTHQQLDYQTVDALFSRSYLLTEDTALSAYAGLRVLFLDQKFKLQTLMQEAKGQPVIVIPEFKFDSSLFGAGIHSGLDFKWNFFDDFGLYTSLSASLLQAKAHNRHEKFTPSSTFLKENETLPFPGYHIGAGINWESCFSACGEESWVTLELGYEMNQWFNTPKLIRSEDNFFLETASKGDLLLQGLTVRLCYEF